MLSSYILVKSVRHIDAVRFDYKLFEEEDCRGTRYVLDGYTYLMHIIQLWPGDWVNQMAKTNEVVGTKNRLTMGGGGKRIVCSLISQEFWKYIGCVLSEVTYGKKEHKVWSEIPKYSGNNASTKIRRDVCGNIYFYHLFYIYACR